MDGQGALTHRERIARAIGEYLSRRRSEGEVARIAPLYPDWVCAGCQRAFTAASTPAGGSGHKGKRPPFFCEVCAHGGSDI